MYRDHNCGELNIKNVGETVLIKNKKPGFNEFY